MERVIAESEVKVCGFRKERRSKDPVICLKTEIRKTQINKESVMTVFFDVENAYDMVRKKDH